jgi:hypothetical protein
MGKWKSEQMGKDKNIRPVEGLCRFSHFAISSFFYFKPSP